jgi:hypothetical protein
MLILGESMLEIRTALLNASVANSAVHAIVIVFAAVVYRVVDWAILRIIEVARARFRFHFYRISYVPHFSFPLSRQ